MNTLSCSCPDSGDWWYIEADDYAPLATKRSRKCCSCEDRIAVGDLTLRLDCYKSPDTDIEERIHGDEVPLRPRFLCERCADLHLSLTELGFCINADDDRLELIRQYAEMRAAK